MTIFFPGPFPLLHSKFDKLNPENSSEFRVNITSGILQLHNRWGSHTAHIIDITSLRRITGDPTFTVGIRRELDGDVKDIKAKFTNQDDEEIFRAAINSARHGQAHYLNWEDPEEEQ